VKSLSRNRGFYLSQCAFIHFSWDHLFCHLCSSSSPKVKPPWMGRHKIHKMLVTLVFFLPIFQVEKTKTLLIDHKLNKRKGKWREMLWRKTRYKLWFRFTLILQCEFHKIKKLFYCNNIDPKGYELASQVDRYLFFAWGQVKTTMW